MFHAYAVRFDVMENLEKFLVGTKQGLSSVPNQILRGRLQNIKN